MIIIGIGANLEHPAFGLPRRTCGAALAVLARDTRIAIIGRSRWYASAPVIRGDTPPSRKQPWYINGAFGLKSGLDADQVLDTLLDVERRFGRERSVPDAPRTLDLDILDYRGQIIEQHNLIVPHPRLQERAFALLPIADLVADWRHPATGAPVAQLIRALGTDQGIDVAADADGFMGTEWHTPGTDMP